MDLHVWLTFQLLTDWTVMDSILVRVDQVDITLRLWHNYKLIGYHYNVHDLSMISDRRAADILASI